MELIGEIKSITDLSNEKIQKKQLVITIDGKYPNDIAIDFIKDKISWLDSAEVGQIATVKVNIQSKEYNGKYYTNINGWGLTSSSNLL